jgi:hypothetical protein
MQCAMVVVVTAAGGTDSGTRVWAYRVAAGLPVALGALTALSGARTPMVWFKVSADHRPRWGHSPGWRLTHRPYGAPPAIIDDPP